MKTFEKYFSTLFVASLALGFVTTSCNLEIDKEKKEHEKEVPSKVEPAPKQ